jgi:predicted negative regulator of RcsB-dependent stress response
MISETTETSHGLEFLAWLEVNKKRVIVAAAVIAVVASAVAIYRWHHAERELQANTALLKAQRAAERNGAGQGPSAEPFLRVANDFRGTSAAGRALLLAAEALYTEGKYAEATQQFESFLRESSGSSFAPTAAFGVAACLDAQGKANEAVAAYQGVITGYPGSAAANQAKLALGGLHESRKELAQAVKLYGELSAPGQQSAWGIEAGMRRENLLRQHPELAPTNPPVLTPLPTSVGSTGLLSASLSNKVAAPPPAR